MSNGEFYCNYGHLINNNLHECATCRPMLGLPWPRHMQFSFGNIVTLSFDLSELMVNVCRGSLWAISLVLIAKDISLL